MSSGVPIRALLSHDFIREVPREDQHVVRLALQQGADREHGQVHAGRERPYLEGTPVHRVGNEVRADRTIVEQRVPLGGRTVARDAPALAGEPLEELAKLRALCRDVARELLPPGKTREAAFSLRIGERPHVCTHVAVTLAQSGIHADRAAMHRHLVDANDREADRLAQAHERRDGEIAEMLVVHGIVLEALEHRARVRHFHDDETVAIDECLRAAQKVLGVVDMGEHVIADDGPRGPTRGSQRRSPCAVEELAHALDTALLRERRDVERRLDAERAYAEVAKAGEQAAVVARHFDDEIIRCESEQVGDGARIRDVVRRNGFRGAGDVDVVAEQQLGVDDVDELDERAGLAEIDVERKGELVARVGDVAQVRVRERLRTEREEAGEAVSSAGPAVRADAVHGPARALDA